MALTNDQILKRAQFKQRRGEGKLKPFLGIVESVNSQEDSLLVSGSIRPTKMEILHPFLSFNAWMRAVPDEGIGVVMQYRYDSDIPSLQYYHSPNFNKRVEGYRNKTNLYRSLLPGELELHSKGDSATYWGRRGHLDDRGGALRRWMDEDALEIGQKAPVHRRVLGQNDPKRVHDEERFGIVKRPKANSPVEEIFPKRDDGTFAKEYRRTMASYAEDSPEVYFDIIEGDVIDGDGRIVKSIKTSNPLRMRHAYFTDDDTEIAFEVDSNGNYTISLPNEAEYGFDIDIPNDKASFRLKVGADFDVKAGKNALIDATDSATLSADTCKIGSPDADQPLVLGTNILNFLMEAFQAMQTQPLGIGNLGAPVPMNPALIAQLTLIMTKYLNTPKTANHILSNKHFTELGSVP